MFNNGQQQGTSGLGGMAADVRYTDAPCSPQVETVGALVEFLKEQAKQLVINGRVIADAVSGSIPQSAENAKQPHVGDLISALREIRHILGEATQETQRARQALGA